MIPATLVAAVLLSGCASSPESKFYVFSPKEGWSSVAARDATASSFVVQFAPVKLPEYLDRPQIVTRTDDNRIRMAQFDRWGMPLDMIAAEVVGASIARVHPDAFVDVVPVRGNQHAGYLVDITVVRLDGMLGGNVELIAQWKITKDGDQNSVIGRRLVRYEQATAGESYGDYVEAVRQVLAKMGDEIARLMN